MVRVLLHSHRVSRISAAAERRIPTKMTAEIRAMAKLCRAGIGPRERPRRRRVTARRMWRETAAMMYDETAVKRKNHVEAYDWVGLQRKLTMLGCSVSQYFTV